MCFLYHWTQFIHIYKLYSICSTISTTEWDRFTLDIISAANKILVDGRPIRAFFDKCLNKMFNDLVSQSDAVNSAFRLRVEEYLEVIEKLNKERDEVCFWTHSIGTYIPNRIVDAVNYFGLKFEHILLCVLQTITFQLTTWVLYNVSREEVTSWHHSIP